MVTVSQLNRYVKSLFDENSLLSEIFIKGEISNFTNHYKSGHFYFTLKDEKASVKAVMFSQHAGFLRFVPENGMSVIVRASVSLFERDGTFQIYVMDMQPDGVGSLQIAYEQLKQRLEREGLFDRKRKKSIPNYPQVIGVVTASGAAALQDILNILSRRYPIATVRLYPVTVQGIQAAPTIVQALQQINEERMCDVIIVARGGGSIEDLWAFNEEMVVRAIANSQIPVITGIGHETDYTLSDFVADVRGATPSETAELVSRNIIEMKVDIDYLQDRVESAMNTTLSIAEAQIQQLSLLRMTQAHAKLYSDLENELFQLQSKSELAIKNLLHFHECTLLQHRQTLSALNPIAVLERGYTATVSKSGKLLVECCEGDILVTTAKDCELTSQVVSAKRESEY